MMLWRRLLSISLGVVGLGSVNVIQERRLTIEDRQPSPQSPYLVDTIWRVGGDEDLSGLSFGAVGWVAVDLSRRILVVDPRLQVVHVLDSLGNLVRSFGRPGDGPGEFRLPTRIAVGPEGHVLVFDQYASRVVEFDSAYQHVRTYSLGYRLIARSFVATPRSVMVSAAIETPGGSEAVIHEFARENGRPIRRTGSLLVVRSIDLARRAGAGPLRVGNDGSVLYAAPGPYRIEVFDTAGRRLLVAERRNRFLPPAENRLEVSTVDGRLRMRIVPQPVVAQIIETSIGQVFHQVSMEDGTVITDEFRFTRTPGATLDLRLVASWADRTPIFAQEFRPGHYLAITSGTAGAGGVVMFRLRNR